METITIYYAGTMYRIVYEPDGGDVIEILRFDDARHAVVVEFDELDDKLQQKIEMAVS